MAALLINIISAIFCAAVFYGDVQSSAQFDKYPTIEEKNKQFRNASGKTKIQKLGECKGALFGATCVGAILCYKFGGGVFSSFVFWAMSAVEIRVVLNNYKLIKKAKAELASA